MQNSLSLIENTDTFLATSECICIMQIWSAWSYIPIISKFACLQNWKVSITYQCPIGLLKFVCDILEFHGPSKKPCGIRSEGVLTKLSPMQQSSHQPILCTTKENQSGMLKNSFIRYWWLLVSCNITDWFQMIPCGKFK